MVKVKYLNLACAVSDSSIANGNGTVGPTVKHGSSREDKAPAGL